MTYSPFTKNIEWGYLRLDELKNFIRNSSPKDCEKYFEDNDDFEEDLDILKDIFELAIENNLDLVCLYS